MKLVFATHNPNKVIEIEKQIPNHIKLTHLTELGFDEEIPETERTLEGNAILKANHIYKKTGMNVFADDTGLEIEVLDGNPGVFSARYAGNNKDSKKNMEKVLKNLKGVSNRKAQFRTVFALIYLGELYLFEGIARGTILEQPKGNKGFGYDPIFCPEGYSDTFAEISLEEKTKISHRGLATQKLIKFLEKISPKR
jgi:XTP/dITP diphosphohydrolase